jgi:hypothetical protein
MTSGSENGFQAHIPDIVPEVAACVSNKDDPTIACNSEFPNSNLRDLTESDHNHSCPSLDTDDNICHLVFRSQSIFWLTICGSSLSSNSYIY